MKSMPIPLNELISTRWSPREYLERPVEPEKLHAVFEAARWAASCFSEEPWRFVFATKAEPDQYEKLFGLLMERNQQWAKGVPVVGFSAARKTFTRNGVPNRWALHDTGAASANLALEANALGLHAHFMGGFDAQRARTEFHVPEDFEIAATFVIGYIDESRVQPGERSRKPLAEIVFQGDWGNPANL